jgi:DNA (cytosine-5)-methyltransferase 1
MRPRLLDLFCKAGGCTKGYQRAGFYVIGVDIEPQPNYCGDEFIQADALEVLASCWDGRGWGYNELGRRIREADAAHASPPCQFATDYIRTGNVRESPNLIPRTRELLEATGLPYVIENVENARGELRDPVTICGSMFDPPLEVQRHRLFETNWPLSPPGWPCRHKLWGPDRFPGGRSKERTGSSQGRVRGTVEVGSWDIPLARQRDAMGIDWMSLPELSQAIPPAYTEHIGWQLMQQLDRQEQAA